MYRSAVGRSTVDAEQVYTVDLSKSFAANGYRVPDLMRTIAVGKIFYAVSAPGKEERVVAATRGESNRKPERSNEQAQSTHDAARRC